MTSQADYTSLETISDHLNLTRDEGLAQKDLLLALVHGATAHTEALCGTLPDPLPDDLSLAIRMLVAHLWENRETTIYGTGTVSSVPFGYDELVLNHRAWAF
jgi:hypothetical protein